MSILVRDDFYLDLLFLFILFVYYPGHIDCTINSFLLL